MHLFMQQKNTLTLTNSSLKEIKKELLKNLEGRPTLQRTFGGRRSATPNFVNLQGRPTTIFCGIIPKTTQEGKPKNSLKNDFPAK